jgi:hypothetical protein
MEPRMKLPVASWDSGGGMEAVQTVVRRAVARSSGPGAGNGRAAEPV